MKNVFIIFTHFHLFLSLCITYFKSEGGSDNLILMSSDSIFSSEELIKRIKKHVFWTDIINLPEGKLLNRYVNSSNLNKILKIITIKKWYPKLNKDIKQINIKNSKFFTFHDGQLISKYILKVSNNVILIEDGAGNYLEYKNDIKDRIKRLFGIYPSFGRNKKIRKIFVQNPSSLPQDIRHKGVKLDLQSMYNDIPENIKDKIIRVFLSEKEIHKIKENSKLSKKILILTQPLSEIKIITENRKIEIYNMIAQKYLKNGYSIFIKPHPYEKTNYKEFFNFKTIIMHKHFPIEILNLKDLINFDFLISLYSSSLKNLNFCKESILLIDFKKGIKTQLKNLQIDN